MQLKYKGYLGYLEARWRLGVGNKDKILAKIEEAKKKGIDIVAEAKELFSGKDL